MRGENESLPELLWGGLLRRSSRVLYRLLALIDWPVKICTAILVGVIIVSVLVFHIGMEKDTLIDAFYRTISLLTTGADMHGEEAPPGSWQKGFISFLRLVGMLLMAAFTAIFTNYLVCADLGAALEVRRIPESGHIIVCGLGNVGFRVVEELRASASRSSSSNRMRAIHSFPPRAARRRGHPRQCGRPRSLAASEFHHRPRRCGGDQRRPAQSRNRTARCRELNPGERVIVRLTDARLAMTLRQAANVPLAMSIPELSARRSWRAFTTIRFVRCFRSRGGVLAVYELTDSTRRRSYPNGSSAASFR